MGTLDFLFSGKPPPATTTYGQSTTNVPQWLNDYTQGLVNKANAVGAAPYVPYQGPRIAQQNADQKSSNALVQQSASAYTPAAKAALSATQGVMGTVNPLYSQAGTALNQAGSTISGAVAPGTGGLSQAMPWLQQASGTYTGQNVSDYMNPYTSNVINAATLAANRNFSQNIMPQLNDQFTANGQYASSRNQEEADRAAYDLTTGLQTNALGALSQAYQQGQGAFATDQSRIAGIGQNVGQLAGQDQSAQLQAGADLGNLGQTYATMANQKGTLGLAAAGQAGQQASDLQKMGITGASALAASGADQQALQQKSLDTAYQDFVAQRQYPQTQLDWMSQIIRGLPANTTTTSTATGPASTYQASPASQLAGLAAGLYGVNQATKTAARGGMIRRYARGGLVKRPYYRGGLIALEG